MNLIIGCESCGRVRFDRAWMTADFVIPDVIGVCRACGERHMARARAQYEYERRRTARRMATGQLNVVRPDDPFENFRNPEPETGRR